MMFLLLGMGDLGAPREDDFGCRQLAVTGIEHLMLPRCVVRPDTRLRRAGVTLG